MRAEGDRVLNFRDFIVWVQLREGDEVLTNGTQSVHRNAKGIKQFMRNESSREIGGRIFSSSVLKEVIGTCWWERCMVGVGGSVKKIKCYGLRDGIICVLPGKKTNKQTKNAQRTKTHKQKTDVCYTRT